MATETSGSKSSSAVDSYIGSLISLTSKCEIRYEGILFSINTEESSIELSNVRSFGTEGRKKDGPQVPPSDKEYDYILFRGSDIKDLQVKAAPPVQPTPSINNDPAIIQSHYSHPLPASTNLPSGVSGPVPNLYSNGQTGFHGSGFQSSLPLYQPGSNLAVPMYWQGYYGPPNGLPHLQQPSLLHPQAGLSMAISLPQPMQYPNYSSSLPTSLTDSRLPEVLSPFLSTDTISSGLATGSFLPSTLTSTFPSTFFSVPSATLTSETSSSLPSKAPIAAPPTLTINPLLPSLSSLTSSPELISAFPTISDKLNSVPGPTFLHQSTSQSAPSVVGKADCVNAEKPTPSLVTPGQLLQFVSTTVLSSQPPQTPPNDVEVNQVSTSASLEHIVPVSREAQSPLLPLPLPRKTSQKPNGAPYQTHHGYRGRERGRGAGGARPVTRFTEDFDFMAMNKKFNKDEVWGHLGKSNRSLSNDKEDRKLSEGDGSQDGDGTDLPKIEAVYNKDEFFDSLSCNTSQNRRPKFSEQRKLDTETFGDLSRHHGGRGGRGPPRGGSSRGGYYGRGYSHGGRSYGYGGRGRGQGMSNRPWANSIGSVK